MNYTADCPVCRNVNEGSCKALPAHRAIFSFDCSNCGRFEASPQAFNWLEASKKQAGEPANLREFTSTERALISHKLRSIQRSEKCFVISQEWLEHLVSEVTLPSPIIQAENLIRFVGREVIRSGGDLAALPDHVPALIGAPSREIAIKLAIELKERGLLRLTSGVTATKIGNSVIPKNALSEINLTLDGWQRYEDERRGRFVGNYGFLAMEFGKDTLDSIMQNTIKPAIKQDTGYDLVDLRDVARAGVIDNIMRTHIRDSAFVIADLTHDNPGAYWEAGYAEGLGKPVVYICEKAKFNERSTHFDTNHCTTVVWSKHNLARFCAELVATLRRSLDETE